MDEQPPPLRGRVVRLEARQGQRAALLDWLCAAWLPAHRAAPGFAGALLLQETGSGDRSALFAVALGRPGWPVADLDVPHAAVVAQDELQVHLDLGMPGGKAARLVDARLIPGQHGRVVSGFENGVLHVATGESGFRRGLLLLSDDGTRALSIGLWESEVALRRSQRSGYLHQQIARFASALAAQPVIEHLLVVHEEHVGAAPAGSARKGS